MKNTHTTYDNVHFFLTYFRPRFNSFTLIFLIFFCLQIQHSTIDTLINHKKSFLLNFAMMYIEKGNKYFMITREHHYKFV